jgi:uncharacterized protein (DUF58 family)
MKKLAALLSVAALVIATAPQAFAKAPAHAHPAMAGKSHEVQAEVVSADPAKSTLTIKGEKDENKTVPVDKKAVASLKTVKAGDKVTLTCWDNAKGEHVKVTAIAKAAN